MTGSAVVIPAPPAALVLSDLQAHLLDAFFAGRNARTVAAYRRDLEDWRTFAGAADMDAAARAILAASHGQANAWALAYKAAMIERGLQPATVNRRLAALRSLVKLGNTLGLVSWKLEVENVPSAAYRDTRGPGRDGVRTLFELAAQPGGSKALRDVAVLRLLHDVALRRGEVVGLDLAHYDPRRGTVAILGKGRTERQLVTLPPAARAAVEAWIAARGSVAGPLFTSQDRARKGSGRLTDSAVYRLVRDLGKKAGIKARPHGLRHSAITDALDRTNGNIRAVRKFSRHKDFNVLVVYDDNRSDLAGDIARLVSED